MPKPLSKMAHRPFVVIFVLALAAAGLSGCGSKDHTAEAQLPKFRPADDAASEVAGAAGQGEATASQRESAVAATGQAINAYQSGGVSSGSEKVAGDASSTSELEGVLAQLNRLAQQAPRGANQQEQIDDLVKTQNQRLMLARKALKLNPEPAVKQQIVVAMYEIYQVLAQPQLRVPGGLTQLLDFAKTMSADADPEIARIGRHAQFSANLAKITAQPLENGKEIVVEAKKLLDAEQGKLSEETLQLVGQTADMFTENGFKDDAVELIGAIAAALAADPKMAEQAPRYALVARLVKADLDSLLNDVVREKPGADEKLQVEIKSLLSEVPPSRDLLSRAQTIAHILESTGHYQAALACYDDIEAAFSKATDPKLAEDAKEIAPAAKLRMGLVGQPFSVEGVTVDGQPFDWSAYAGKVVLIDFWATWCGPCLEELPNIKQNFEQFHAKGFEVVGVNLNTNVAELKQFLTLQDLPWATVTSQPVLDGKVGEHDWPSIPMAAKSGVQAIPFVVLVNKEGKVDSIHVRGPKLRSRLVELLGEPAAAEVPADPTQPQLLNPSGKAPAGKQSRYLPTAPSPLGWLLAAALLTAEPAAPATDEPQANPYLAKPGQNATQLVAYIEKMLDRPQAIQQRPGFADALVDACDRVLKAEPPASDREQLVAIEAKLTILHREACDGKAKYDEQLVAFLDQLQENLRPEIAQEVSFLRLEQRALRVQELPLSEVPALVKEVQDFASHAKLTGRHLRLASATVAAINRLESGDEREEQFAALGGLLAKSSDKEVARYGKKLAKKPADEAAAASR